MTDSYSGNLSLKIGKCCRSINTSQLFNLLTGMFGIYLMYFIAGLIHESIIKKKYMNASTGIEQLAVFPFGITFIPTLIAWIMGSIYVKFAVSQPVIIPHKNAALAALAATSAAFFSIIAISHTSFPVIMMMESSSILPVVFVAVCCSRVTDRNLKLGPKKIIVAIIITAGIFMFEISDPSNKSRENKQQLIGLFFVLGYFVADGFLPDLQAEIKIKYKPHPVEMMAAINKWGTLYMFIGMIITGHILGFAKFMFQHPLFSLQLFAMSVISGFGQFFVYRMIKQFKQHFVPFTITSRKILTVALSIIVYGHQTNVVQILGVLIVLITVIVEFITELMKQPEKKQGDINFELNQQMPQQPQKQQIDEDLEKKMDYFTEEQQKPKQQNSQSYEDKEQIQDQKSEIIENQIYDKKNNYSEQIESDPNLTDDAEAAKNKIKQ